MPAASRPRSMYRSSPMPIPATATSSMPLARCGSTRARGVAGLHIEDQASPKKCGHLDNKVIVRARRVLAKIRAAVAARARSRFRRSSRAPTRAPCSASRKRSARQRGARRRRRHGLRGGAADAGGGRGGAAVGAAGRACSTWCWRGKTPERAARRAERLGYKLAIVPGMLFDPVISSAMPHWRSCSTPASSRSRRQHDRARHLPTARRRRLGSGARSFPRSRPHTVGRRRVIGELVSNRRPCSRRSGRRTSSSARERRHPAARRPSFGP